MSRRDDWEAFAWGESDTAVSGFCGVAFCRAVEAPPETPWTNAG